MNYIQRQWLVILRPIANFVNHKLAKKSGMLGRIGRFYAFGPRQYGVHTSNKALAYINSILVQNIGLLLHKYSFVKSLTMNGHTYMRSFRFVMHIGMACLLSAIFTYVVPNDHGVEEGTSLQYIKDRLDYAPINALQHRTSAHFTEINSHYTHQMTLRVLQKKGQLIRKISHLSHDQISFIIDGFGDENDYQAVSSQQV